MSAHEGGMMSIGMAFSGTAPGDFLFAALVFAALKMIVAAMQIAMMKGNYKDAPQTLLFRIVYAAGKITPVLMVLCAFVSAVLQHQRGMSWFYGGFAVFVAVLAWFVVRLRKQGKFFGVLDVVTSGKR